jgi:hypothetical protein
VAFPVTSLVTSAPVRLLLQLPVWNFCNTLVLTPLTCLLASPPVWLYLQLPVWWLLRLSGLNLITCLVASAQVWLLPHLPVLRHLHLSCCDSHYLSGSFYTCLHAVVGSSVTCLVVSKPDCDSFWWLHQCGSDSSYLSYGFNTCLIRTFITCLVAGFTEKMSRNRM